MNRDLYALPFFGVKFVRLVVVIRDEEGDIAETKMGRDVRFFCMYF